MDFKWGFPVKCPLNQSIWGMRCDTEDGAAGDQCFLAIGVSFSCFTTEHRCPMITCEMFGQITMT